MKDIALRLRDWVYEHYHWAYLAGTWILCQSLFFPSKRLTILAWLCTVVLGVFLEPCVNPKRQMYGRTLWRLSPKHDQVALTFDDGPSGDTEEILDILREFEVKATFFCVGEQIEAHPQTLARIAREGHLIGNHTYSHCNMMLCGRAESKRQLTKTQQLIAEISGQTPQFWRAPFGFRAPWTQNVAARLGLRSALWSINPRDFQNPGVDVLVARVMETLQSGVIVLLHDGFQDRQQTVQALRKLIPLIREKGYKFVRLDEATE